MSVGERSTAPDSMDPRAEGDSLGRTGPSRRRARAPVLVSLLLGTCGIVLGLVGDRAESTGGGVILAVSDATAELIGIRLPVEVNEQVEYWIGRFTGPQRPDFEAYLVREGLYGGMIRDRLRSRGMPEDLLYMAMIESGFLATAISPVTASGVWQFMQPTAVAYGLDVDEWVDERLDPVRATDAALDYLEELYAEFGSWYLAAAAYNAGPGLVARTIQRHTPTSLRDDELYWEIRAHLPRKNRAYVPKMLAAAVLVREADRFGFEVEKSLPYLFDQVLVPNGTSLAALAATLDVPGSLLAELNPHLIRGATPPDRSYVVRVPKGDSNRLVTELNGIVDWSTTAGD